MYRVGGRKARPFPARRGAGGGSGGPGGARLLPAAREPGLRVPRAGRRGLPTPTPLPHRSCPASQGQASSGDTQRTPPLRTPKGTGPLQAPWPSGLSLAWLLGTGGLSTPPHPALLLPCSRGPGAMVAQVGAQLDRPVCRAWALRRRCFTPIPFGFSFSPPKLCGAREPQPQVGSRAQPGRWLCCLSSQSSAEEREIRSNKLSLLTTPSLPPSW